MLEVRLLGQFEVSVEGESVDLPSRPAQSLLAYLLLNAGASHRREKLAGLLWPESDEENARSNLRHALWRLRKSVGGEYIEADNLSVGFDTDNAYFFDVELLEREPSEERALVEAVSAYAGELLPGFYEDWVLLERERLQALFDQRMSAYLDLMLDQGRWAGVIEWSERWIAHGQVPEPAYRALMQAHSALGDVAGVSAAFQRCLDALESDLGVKPSRQTLELFERLSTGEVEPAKQETGGVSAVSAQRWRESSPPPAFLGQEDAESIRQTFVARQAELEQLEAYLDQAVEGAGQVAFVTGEAGRGKTALVQEFARRALERHPELVVVQGTCQVYTGVGDPYVPFRDALNMLAGEVEAQWASGSISRQHALRLWSVSPRAAQAIVEKGPDLIGPFVSGQALQSRVRALQVNGGEWRQRLSNILNQQNTRQLVVAPHKHRFFEEYSDVVLDIAGAWPVVLILDDLHWVDHSSASLLFHLVRRARGSPVFILGTYRPEDISASASGEPHPLDGVLSEFKRMFGNVWIDLDQSDAEASRRFVDALLDVEPNRLDDGFRQKLAHTTGDHPLFILELAKDLQERGELVKDESGAWIAGHELDWEVMPARIEGVIEKRMGRLDRELHEALTLAAVEGETFTSEAIAQIMNVDERALARRFSRELGRQHRLIVERSAQRVGARRLSQFRFRHILFQRYLYQNLGDVERVHLHEEMGRSLEALYADEVDRMSVELARHFLEADIPEKAVVYLERAGARALAVSANQEAVSHLTEALRLMEAMPPSLEPSLEVEGGEHIPFRARLERLLGEACYGLGDLEKSRLHLEAAVSRLGKPTPAGRGPLLLGILAQVLRQISHRLIPTWRLPLQPAAQGKYGQAAAIYETLAEIYLFANDALRTFYAVIRALNLAERTGDSAELARAYADMSAICPAIGLQSVAELYRRRALNVADTLGQDPVSAYVLLATSVYMLGEGRWEECMQSLRHANQIHDRIGDWNRLGIGLSLLAHSHYFVGRLGEHRSLYSQLRELAKRSASVQHQTWALDGLAENLIRRGGPDHGHNVIELVEESLALQGSNPDLVEAVIAHAMMAMAHLRLGQQEKARLAADQAARYMSEGPPSLYSLLEGYSNVAEVYLTLLESGADTMSGRRRSPLASPAARACHKLDRFTRAFPIGRPRAQAWQGLNDWLSGRARRARRRWELGMGAARRLGMPYDEALCAYQLGRHLASDHPDRLSYLGKARDLFQEIGAEWDLRNAEAEIAATSRRLE